jgi:hypothetical protein
MTKSNTSDRKFSRSTKTEPINNLALAKPGNSLPLIEAKFSARLDEYDAESKSGT